MNHFKLVDPRSVPRFVYQFVNSPGRTFPYPPPVQDRKFFEKLAKMVISKPQNWNPRSQIQIHTSVREIFWVNIITLSPPPPPRGCRKGEKGPT